MKLCSVNVGHTSEAANVVSAYYIAKGMVVSAGYAPEIEWQSSLRFEEVTESDFLREYSWVVLTTGMRESVVRQRFGLISNCFFDYESSRRIVSHAGTCRERALQHFNHPGKIRAIIQVAHLVASVGFEKLKESIRLQPLETLKALAYIGPTTSHHLAKNLGLPFAKADRHLVRLANSVGYSDVQQFCKDISEYTGDSVPVVDIVLWRFATIEHAYLNTFYDVAVRGAKLDLQRTDRDEEGNSCP